MASFWVALGQPTGSRGPSALGPITREGVDPAGYESDDALAGWVQRGLDFVSTLPAKPAATRGGSVP